MKEKGCAIVDGVSGGEPLAERSGRWPGLFALSVVFVSAAQMASATDTSCGLPIRAVANVAFGAYLAGECAACHRGGAARSGMPKITGWTGEAFAQTLDAYKCGTHQHAVMQMIAVRLGPDEIAALAAYFKDLE